MTKTMLVSSLTLSVLLAGLASLAAAQPGWGGHRGGPMGAFAVAAGGAHVRGTGLDA